MLMIYKFHLTHIFHLISIWDEELRESKDQYMLAQDASTLEELYTVFL